MPDIRILTEGDSSVLVEFGKEISPENMPQRGVNAQSKMRYIV